MYNLLVVDDEENVRQNIVDYFEDYDFVVHSFEFPSKAIEFIKNNIGLIDFAIIDMRLPDMTGEDLILKLNELDKNIKFIIHTGSVNFIVRDNLKSIGIKQDAVFFKPLDDMSKIKDYFLF